MTVRRILARTALGVLGMVVSGVAIIMALSEARLRRTYDVPLTTIDVPRDPVSIAEGERLARIRGCYGGCHGTTLEGGPFFERPGVARIPAPNLTAVLPEYSDPELARVIRRGVKRDGRSVFAMPSEMFAELTDEDLGRIMGFLRTHPGIDRPSDEFRVGPLGRMGLVFGRFRPVAARVQAVPARSAVNTTPVAKGRYLARTACTECHGRDLNGSRDGTVPDLAIGAAFPDADFLRLVREGRGLGGRELALMGRVAQSRFAYFTDDEIGAVHEYLKHRAAHPEQEPYVQLARTGLGTALAAAVLLPGGSASGQMTADRTQSGDPHRRGMEEHNITQVMRLYEEAYHNDDYAVADEIFAPDYIRHDASAPVEGPGEAVLQSERTREVKQLIPDARYIAYQVVAADSDIVAVRWQVRGTPSGTPGLMRRLVGKSGSIQMSGANMFRFRHGRVVELWTNRDDLKMAREMGLFRMYAAGGFIAGLIVAALIALGRRSMRDQQLVGHSPSKGGT